jgi:hypothetical protein
MLNVPHQLYSVLILCVMCSLGGTSLAASLEPGEEKLVLNPPHAEIPPTFWEQFGVWLVTGVFLLLVFVVVAVMWKLRPKPPIAIPIEVRTREELTSLLQRPEDGRALGRISRSLRTYLTVAFELPAGEMTTAEFCVALGRNGKIGAELAAQTGEFLRGCDERKFNPESLPAPPGAVEQALKLVESGEVRRAALQTAAASRPPVIK